MKSEHEIREALSLIRKAVVLADMKPGRDDELVGAIMSTVGGLLWVLDEEGGGTFERMVHDLKRDITKPQVKPFDPEMN